MNIKLGAIKYIGILSICFVMGMSFRTFAAEITSVNIDVRDNYPAIGISEPTITSNSGSYTVEDISWNRDMEDWKPGKKVEVTLTLNSTGNTFKTSYTRNNCKISGADFISAKADGDSTLIVRAYYIPVAQLGDTERAAFTDANKTKAVWKKVEYATAYQLRLYEDDSLKKSLTVTTNSVDLAEYMRNGYSYYYEVRATAETSAEGKYMKNGQYVASEDSVEPELGDTSGQWRSYTSGSKYKDESGNYVTNSWKMIFGKWYYFNAEGYAVTNWLNNNSKWYFLEQDGVMKTGWVFVNNTWYYLDASGAMVTGWLQAQPGTWYYLDTNGAMLTNTMIGEYQLDSKGVWLH